MRKVEIAENSGFCFGVNNAVTRTLDALAKTDEAVFSYGDLIHNKEVIDSFKKKGLKTISHLEDLQYDASEIIIRSHGISLTDYKTLENKNVKIIDCTCPYVRRIQKMVEKFHQSNKQIIILGDCTHPEVKGINGWCESSAFIVNTLEEIDRLPLIQKEIIVVSQTTMECSNFKLLSNKIDEKYNQVTIYNTICDATMNRQNDCHNLSKRVDFMIIIGGKNSSNTKKLYDISKTNCINSVHVETEKDLHINILKDYNHIGLIAGASTPYSMVEKVYNKIKEADNNIA